MIQFFTLYLCLIMVNVSFAETSVTMTEILVGNVAELSCLSNDNFHKFMFWQLIDSGYIIGPGNPLNENKYNYEVLTGKLYIMDVSIAESGFYKCISRGIENNSILNIHIVELIVKNDIQEQAENLFEIHLLKGIAIIIVIIEGLAIILLIVMLKRRRAQHSFFDILLESRKNSPEKYMGNVHFASMTQTPKTPQIENIKNMDFNVNFPKVFQQIKNGETMPF